MKQPHSPITKLLIGVCLMTALCFAACGGQESDEPSPTAPSLTMCGGTPLGGCAEIDPEFCVQLECALQRTDERSVPVCSGDRPAPCETISTQYFCGRVPGCAWAE